jgi:hypothetical protein
MNRRSFLQALGLTPIAAGIAPTFVAALPAKAGKLARVAEARAGGFMVPSGHARDAAKIFARQRTFSLDEITRVYRVPPEALT